MDDIDKRWSSIILFKYFKNVREVFIKDNSYVFSP